MKSKFARFLIVLPSFLIFHSCNIQGLTNDFGKLDEHQKAKILHLNQFNNLKPGVIYLVNASQLKEELRKYSKSIVYIFTNGCSSKYCKPLSVYENYAKKYDYKIFFVMTGFADLDKTTDQEIQNPLFAIDNQYYKSSLRSKYVLFFTNELLDKPMKSKDSEYLGSLYFFRNGKFEKILRELPD